MYWPHFLLVAFDLWDVLTYIQISTQSVEILKLVALYMEDLLLRRSPFTAQKTNTTLLALVNKYSLGFKL
jgi:hypothetical protein